MAKFELGKPITTTTSTVVVDGGLPIGRQRFRLVVSDSAGNVSAPVEVIVSIAAGVGTVPTGPVGPALPTLPIGPVIPTLPIGPVLPNLPVGPIGPISPGPLIAAPTPAPARKASPAAPRGRPRRER